MTDEFNLERFVTAQNSDETYEHAIAELRSGQKLTHWMWFVFPQIAGLGQSVTSRRYAIASLAEALAYLRHPVLGPRLIECAGTVAEVPNRSAEQIFGGIDAQKLHSSMTLFAEASPNEATFGQVLERFFGGSTDVGTLRLLRVGPDDGVPNAPAGPQDESVSNGPINPA